MRDIFLVSEPPDGGTRYRSCLTVQGVPTKRGARLWHRQVVRQILSNRTYIGEFYQNRWDTTQRPIRPRPKEEWIYIPCPAIIEREVFDQVQQALASLSLNSRS